MQLRAFFEDREAVSPVIGVILMVAITVILAAVIGTFVLGLGDQVGDSAPNAQFDAEVTAEEVDDTGGEFMQFTHDGGDSVANETLSVGLTGNSDGNGGLAELGEDDFTAERLSAGDTVSVSTNGDAESGNVSIAEGSTVNLIWESGDRSSTLRSFTVPTDIEAVTA